MKLRYFNFFLSLFVFSNSFSQVQDIEILNNKVGNNYAYSVKNNSTERKEVTLTINGEGFAKTASPITKLVNKGATVVFAVLRPIKGATYKVETSGTFVSKPSVEEITARNERLKNYSVGVNEDLTKGIVVFTKDGCPRCELTLKYLDDNSIKFKRLNTTENADVHALMWKKIKEKGDSQEVTMPVIIVDNKISYSHKDLSSFLHTIK